ncbi:SpoIIE family protein phosphatase [Streptomyces sp. NPDC059894]|uniref:SpoIIE family protein phosphatase n=1 Tax=unclassified Streptomyces TaxID=2593676 RepID=UPI0036602461
MTGRATAVLDARFRFVGWSPEAEILLGYRPEEVLGRTADDVLGEEFTRATPRAADGREAPGPTGAYGIRSIRHRDGRALPVALSLGPLPRDLWLMVAMDVGRLHRRTVDRAVLAGLYHQSPVMLVVYDTDARVQWINDAIETEFGISLEETAGLRVPEILPEGVLLSPEGRVLRDVEQPIRDVLRTGQPVTDIRFQSTTRLDPHHRRFWSLSYFRLHDDSGRTIGVCEVGLDITDRYAARGRLSLLSRASGGIGTTLDIRRTGEDLAGLVVPEFADAITVEVLEPVLSGQEPPSVGPDAAPELRRVAHRARDEAAGGVADAVDDTRLRCLSDAASLVDPATGALVVPLTARGVVLGVAVLVRTAPRDPFDTDDMAVAGELVSRTAVCLDNARRYAREHATALTLQRDLLPHGLPRPTGVEIAHRYLPAEGPAGVGGDWYDVIPLSGARVGLVVGDVAGHGLGAAATMGRLRTTVAALAALDLEPGELLARLDDLVARAGSPPSADLADEDQALGVTCLYAVYDAVSRHCVMARAGHPPPALVTADGRTELVSLPSGPPLGLGGLPFESTEFDLSEGSVLALFTNGLVASRRRDIDTGISALCDTLSQVGSGPLQQACDGVVGALLSRSPEDDAALLLVRVHALPEDRVATWDIPVDSEEVARARSLSRDRLARWGMPDETSFVLELVVSELVTNAIRYGGAPVRLRLIRDRGLIVEVSDGGHTSPHLRRAATEDEGGRGLFLVAQVTEHWGTRYTSTGKTIWTQMPSEPRGLPAAAYGF